MPLPGEARTPDPTHPSARSWPFPGTRIPACLGKCQNKAALLTAKRSNDGIRSPSLSRIISPNVKQLFYIGSYEMFCKIRYGISGIELKEDGYMSNIVKRIYIKDLL